MDDDAARSPARRWAHLRFSVIGRLLACPPPKGELTVAFEELASQRWCHPVDGTWTTFGASTIERWYYLAKDAPDPIAALERKVRKDAGKNKAVSPALLLALKQQYKDHSGWSYKLHADNLAALAAEKPEKYGQAPSYSTVRRRMVERGWTRRRKRRNPTPGQRRAEERLERFEVRSFEATHVHALWHLDFHEAKTRRIADARGEWNVPVVLCILDDRSRLCCHMQWYLAESAENLFHGLHQAFVKRGLPRALMHDNGGAMRADETRNGLRDNGIIPKPTLAYSPYQNAKQENFWSQVEGRLMAMLEDVEPLELGFLNRATQAWAELDYNRHFHEEIGTAPLERLLQGPEVSRPAPGIEKLRRTFAVEQGRTQRKSDGTISIEGVRFEVPSRLRTLNRMTVRYQRWDLSVAWIVDDRTQDVLARIRPQDKARNADGRRRALQPLDDLPALQSPGEKRDPLPPLMRKLLAEYAATGAPPAFLPKDEAALRGPATDPPEPEETTDG